MKGTWRLILEVVSLLAGLATITTLAIRVEELEKDKYTIYKYFIEILNNRESTIEKLRNENLLYRNQLQQFETELRTIYGKVSSINGTIPDVKIEIKGSSVVYSNSNGEFLIQCKAGLHIIFEKNGYDTYEYIVNEEDFEKNPLEIGLTELRR